MKTTFDKARQKTGLNDFRFHDLRHTFASRLVQKGVPIYEVMHLKGYKSLVMVQRYAHLVPDYQSRAIAALNDFGRNIGTVDRDVAGDKQAQNGQNPLVSQGVLMVEPIRIELTTSTMPL